MSAQPQPRRPTREDMVEAASRLLAEEGPDALSVRRVAAAVGTSTQAIYTLFGGKPGLAEALYAEGFRRLAEAFAEVDEVGDPVERLHRLGRAYRHNARANPAFYLVMFGRPIPGFEPSAESRRRAGETFDALLEAVTEAAAVGAIAIDEPRDVARALWASCHGVTSLELSRLMEPEVADRVARSIATALLDA